MGFIPACKRRQNTPEIQNCKEKNAALSAFFNSLRYLLFSLLHDNSIALGQDTNNKIKIAKKGY